jgi:predicted HTH domain antitoxin
MQVTVELPDDIARCLKEKRPDLSRSVLEAVRDGTISAGRPAEMLGISRDEMDAILKRADVYLDYTLEDLERDRETHRRLGILMWLAVSDTSPINYLLQIGEIEALESAQRGIAATRSWRAGLSLWGSRRRVMGIPG